MAFTPCSTDTSVISQLSDKPNTDDGLSAAQLKAKFDEAATGIKNFINNTLLAELIVGGKGLVADKWASIRSFVVKDADNSHSGASASVDGSSDVTLNLPDTIKASIVGDVNGNASTASNLADGSVLSVAKGGTGAATAADARTALGVPALNADGKVQADQASASLSIKTADATLSLTDCGKLVFCQNGATDITLTIPADPGDIPAGTEIEVFRNDAGKVSIVCASGATLFGVGISGSCKITDQYAACALKKIGSNWWIVTGSVEAAT